MALGLNRNLQQQALQGDTIFPFGDNNAAMTGISAQGPGSSSSGQIEEILAAVGSDVLDKSKAAGSAVPSLNANPNTRDSIEQAAVDQGAGSKTFKDMSKREKFGAILGILGNALAVASSQDPGVALSNQIRAIAEQQQLLNARRDRFRERLEDREFQREQLATDSQARFERERMLIDRKAQEANEEREFELKREMDRFLRESGFKREMTEREIAARRAETGSLRAEQKGERRNAEITQRTMDLAPLLASIGQNDEGVSDSLGRARRVATAVVDGKIDELSDFDKSAVEFMLRKSTAENPMEERKALLEAASRLVGKKQPVPTTRQVFNPDGTPELDQNGKPVYEIVRDPATGRAVPMLDHMGNVLEAPMSYEEALAVTAYGVENHEFVEGRQLPQEELQRAQAAGGLTVNPSKIKPEHMHDVGGNVGLLSTIGGQAQSSEELEELFHEFEDEMKSRGFTSGFSPDVWKVIKARGKQIDAQRRKLDTMLDSTYDPANLNPLMSGTGMSVR